MGTAICKYELSDTESTNSAQAEAILADRDAGAGLTRVIGELARGLAGKPDLDATVIGISAAAVAAVPGASYAGVTRVVSRGRMVVCASTDEVAGGLDRLQAALQQGPSISVLRQHRSVSIATMADERRWPAFTQAADRLGVGSMLSLRLFVNEKTFGALNLYATEPHAFTADDKTLAQAFAAHAAIALHDADKLQGFSQAIASRDIIGQAKGILMGRHRATADEAFDMLVAASQQSNIKLVDIARRLVGEPDHLARGESPASRPTIAPAGIQFRPPATIAAISGEIDESNVHEVGRYVTGLISTSHRLILDFSGVEFLSVAGLRLLDSIEEQCAQAELEWVLISSDAVNLMLRLACRENALPVYGSATAALDGLTGSTAGLSPSPPITAPSLVRC